MTIRLATFNVENLFNRPRAMNQTSWKEGQPAIDAAHELNDLFQHEEYTVADKKRMLELLGEHGLLASRPNNRFLEFRKYRAQLLHVPRSGPAEIVAKGRADWVGWIDLKLDPIEDEAIVNTARVIAEVNADVLVMVEVESRPTLQSFHDGFIAPEMKKRGQSGYPFNMVIDGNDPRGIDVGILSRYPVSDMRSHITDALDGKRIFSRDCPEYYVSLGDVPSKDDLVILPNHFASKGSDHTGKRRAVQAERVRQIYESIRSAGYTNVVIAGDFNDDPASGALDALLKQADLRDAMASPKYTGKYPGTYQHATAKEKFDYLLLSPALTAKLTAVDVDRHGYYAPEKWESFENINKETKDRFQASDHHCVWADVDL